VVTLLEYFPSALTMALFVAIGLDLTVADFERIRAAPALVITGLLAPLLVLPPLAIGLAAIPGVPSDARLGLLLIAVSPVGGFSTIYSYLAKASPALSVALTTLSGLAAPLTIPLVSAIVVAMMPEPVGLTAPTATIARFIVTAVVGPMLIGMWMRHRRPDLASYYRPLLGKLTLAGVIVLIGLIVAADPASFFRALADASPVVTLFVIGSFAAGWMAGLAVGAAPRDQFTLAAEFTARNAGVAMAIALAVLDRFDLARFGILYVVLEAPFLLTASALFRRSQKAGSSIAT
jgi:bile acid:Na+ symporter, BASS family